jgi:phosphinothricin acetyltransferase
MSRVRLLETKDFKQVTELFSQLTSDPIEFDGEGLISDNNSNCIVIEEDGKVVGFAALATYRVPTKGLVARVEDVIIEEGSRGRGYGNLLMQELIKIAQEKNVCEINLTSNPKREVARKLYESIGFKLRDTGEFRLKL